MTNLVLKAEKRDQLGTLKAKKIKRAGRIPAVIYGAKGNINLTVDAKEFEHEYYKGNCQTTVLDLDLEGKKIKVIAHKIELDPVSDHPIHIDFLNCDEAKSIKAQPKINFVNQDKSPGLKRGALLNIVLRKVSVLCENIKSVPEKIDVDVGSMLVGHKVRGANLVLPAGVTLANKAGKFLIASIVGRASKTDAEEAAAAGGAPAATPAAGAAKAPAAAKPAAKK